MINDLGTDCMSVKYVDNTTVYHATNNPSEDTLQNAINAAFTWSKANKMMINDAKIKDMIVSFAKKEPEIP